MKLLDAVIGFAAGYCAVRAARVIARNRLSAQERPAYGTMESPAAAGIPPRRDDGNALRTTNTA